MKKKKKKKILSITNGILNLHFTTCKFINLFDYYSLNHFLSSWLLIVKKLVVLLNRICNNGETTSISHSAATHLPFLFVYWRSLFSRSSYRFGSCVCVCVSERNSFLLVVHTRFMLADSRSKDFFSFSWLVESTVVDAVRVCVVTNDEKSVLYVLAERVS